jgi:hypothetical protein
MADPEIIENLNKAYVLFDSQDSWRALFATIDLFRNLSTEVALKSGYRYPQKTDDAISNLILKYYSTI